MIDIINEKYFAYVASSYGITFLVFMGLIMWILMQHRSYRAELARMKEQGITRRSSRQATKGQGR